MYVEEENYANVYVAAFPGYFQEPRAHLPIIRAFCINNEPREDLWGGYGKGNAPKRKSQKHQGRKTDGKENDIQLVNIV